MAEQRQHQRFRVHWRVAVRIEGGQMLYGETVDISIGGVCILLDQNLNCSKPVHLFIQMPSRRPGKEPDVVSAPIRILYSAYAADFDRWRLGAQFVDLPAAERAKLEKELMQQR